MRVLWVKMGGLWPLNTGGRQRTFQMLSELARRHRVVLLTTHGPDDDPKGLTAALQHAEQVVSLPFRAPKQGSRAFIAAMVRSWFSALPVDLFKWRAGKAHRFVENVLAEGGTDVIVADFLTALPNIPVRPGTPVVFFAHNVEHQIWRRLRDVERRWWRRGLLSIEWRKMRAQEGHACRRATLTVAVSAEDRDRLAAQAPGATVVDVPTGVDVDYFRPIEGSEILGRLVFSGSMDWYPNEDGILYFVREILPRVRQERPDVTLTVVGRRPSDHLRAVAERAGVTVTGTVPDVRPYLAEAALYVVPLRVGGGTRLKIFEALAMGIPVLSTGLGAEGLTVVDGQHLVLADGAEAFSRQVVALLNDSVRRRSLSLEGRRLVEEQYAWPKVTQVFEGHLERACRARRADS
jgi:glycosyltransferase involved in cell wall biosynthesis